MSNTTEDILREGMEMTPASNVKAFVKRFDTIPEGEVTTVLKKIFKHHYTKGNFDIFDRIRDELRVHQGLNAPSMVPPTPRGQWYNVVRTPDGSESILIGDVIYLKPKNSEEWTYKGGKKHRKASRKTLRRKTRRTRKQK